MERPIIFSGPMVRAILDGRKTQTRRVIKSQPYFTKIPPGADPREQMRWKSEDSPDWPTPDRCPYGQPGDRLWVRETWAVAKSLDSKPALHFAGWPVKFKADDQVARLGFGNDPFGKWRPSIHMPRWASRLLLEVLSVRVEQVQEITADDCREEGHPRLDFSCFQNVHDEAALEWFMDLWDSINGKRGFGWDVNPWVRVVEFKRIK